MCKIVGNQADYVAGIISSKAGLQCMGPDMDVIKSIAGADSERLLKPFEIALRKYKAQLEQDSIFPGISRPCMTHLCDKNLCRLIEPFSRVEIAEFENYSLISEVAVTDDCGREDYGDIG